MLSNLSDGVMVGQVSFQFVLPQNYNIYVHVYSFSFIQNLLGAAFLLLPFHVIFFAPQMQLFLLYRYILSETMLAGYMY